MADNEIDRLVARIEADTSELRSELNKAKGMLTTFGKTSGGELKAVTAHFRGLRDEIFNVRNALLGLGAGLILRNIVQTAAEFEKLRAQLKTVTGSAQAAEQAFQGIIKFASRTPFTVQSIVSAFIRLRAVGIDPTAERLEAFGNAAAAFGTDITQFSEAVVGAVTGETERLKAFGVVAKIEGDNISFIFDNQTKTVKRSAESITRFLTEMAQTRFGGAMDEQAKTLLGAFSNLEDQFSALADSVGRAGLNEALVDLAKSLASIGGEGTDTAEQLGHVLATAVRGLTSALEFAAENSRELTTALAAFAAYRLAALFGGAAYGVALLAKALLVAGRAQNIMNLLLSKSGIGLLLKVAVAATAAAAAYEAFGKEVGEAIDHVEESLGNLLGATKEAGESTDLSNLTKKIEALRFESDLLTSSYSEAARALAQDRFDSGDITDLADGMNSLVDASEEAIRAYKDFLDEFNRNRNIKDGKALIEATKTAQEEFNESIARYKELLDAGTISQETFNRGVAKAEEKLKSATDQGKQTENIMKDLGATFSSSFEDAIAGGKGLSDVLRGLEQDLMRIAARRLITEPLFAALFGGEGSSGGGFFGSLTKSFLGSAKGNAFSSSIQPFAKGGVVNRPQVFPMARGVGLMGEAGPEAILPLQRDRNGRLGVSGGGTPVQVSVHVENHVGDAKASVEQSQGPGGNVDLRVIIDRIVAENIRPGSKTFRALRDQYGLNQQTIGR